MNKKILTVLMAIAIGFSVYILDFGKQDVEAKTKTTLNQNNLKAVHGKGNYHANYRVAGRIAIRAFNKSKI